MPSRRGSTAVRSAGSAERPREGAKQIAATLFLSDKTMADALTRVYTKLGVHSRTQLSRTHIHGPAGPPPPGVLLTDRPAGRRPSISPLRPTTPGRCVRSA